MSTLWGRDEKQGLTHECTYGKCLKHPPKKYFDKGGTLVGGCPDYMGYGYCKDTSHGKDITESFHEGFILMGAE